MYHSVYLHYYYYYYNEYYEYYVSGGLLIQLKMIYEN